MPLLTRIGTENPAVTSLSAFFLQAGPDAVVFVVFEATAARWVDGWDMMTTYRQIGGHLSLSLPRTRGHIQCYHRQLGSVSKEYQEYYANFRRFLQYNHLSSCAQLAEFVDMLPRQITAIQDIKSYSLRLTQ